MNPATFEKALRAVGVEKGDLLFIHSDLRPFGIPENTSTKEEILQFYLDQFLRIVGPRGTLAVPAYFYEYARFGETFDVDHSPVSTPLGVLSAFVNQQPGRVRSLNPLQSIAAIGHQAEALCGGESLMGYGPASPWHRLCQNKGKIIFLGTSLQPMTFVHHIEQQFGVPHLYQKMYQTAILYRGKAVPGIPISSVRYLNYDIHYDLKFFQEELKKRGQLRHATLGKGEIFLVVAEEAFQTGLELLSQNPFCFLKKVPSFVPGQIPLDGKTGEKT